MEAPSNPATNLVPAPGGGDIRSGTRRRHTGASRVLPVRPEAASSRPRRIARLVTPRCKAGDINPNNPTGPSTNVRSQKTGPPPEETQIVLCPRDYNKVLYEAPSTCGGKI